MGILPAYVTKMLEEFPIKFNRDSSQSTPAGVDMFNKDESKPLNNNERETFHKTTAQGLFLGKRGRPDLQPIILVLCTQVKRSGRNNWNKLVRMMKYLFCTRNDILTIDTRNGVHRIEWSIDSAF